MTIHSATTDPPVTLGVKVSTSTMGQITQVKWVNPPSTYTPASTAPTTVGVWSSSGTLLGSQSTTGAVFSTTASTGVNVLTLTTPISIAAGATFTVVAFFSSGSFMYSASAIAAPTGSPFTSVLPQYKWSSTFDYPTLNNNNHYGIDFTFSVPTPATNIVISASTTCIASTNQCQKFYDAAGTSGYYLQFESSGDLSWKTSAGVVVWSIKTASPIYGTTGTAGNYALIMQGDGSLVVYSASSGGSVRWGSDTNLVGATANSISLYSDTRTHCLWIGAAGSTYSTYFTQTYGGMAAGTQLSGQLPGKVLYCPSYAYPAPVKMLSVVTTANTNAVYCVPSLDSISFWISDVNGLDNARYAFQDDGNVVYYAGSTSSTSGWTTSVVITNTAGRSNGVAYCLFANGNFAIYDGWNSRTAAPTGTAIYTKGVTGTTYQSYSLYLDSAGCSYIATSATGYTSATIKFYLPTGATCS